MKVAITGALGFVGRELISQCERNGIECVGIDFAEGSGNNYFRGDIRSKEVTDCIPENADALIHLAALSRDNDCRNKAYECFDINVMGTLNLINAAEKRKVRQFIFASSEWVYDNCTPDVVKDEESPINPANLTSEYALSKLVGEANLRQRFQHGFCDTTILRFGIIYGPRKSNWSAVESVFNSVLTQDEIRIGSLKTGRCFIHVSDIAKGIISSIGLKGFDLLNLEGSRLITLGDIIDMSKRISGRNPGVKETDPSKASVRNISNLKAKEILKWAPEMDLENGLRSLV